MDPTTDCKALLDHFAALDDPRQAAKVLYPLPEVVLLLLCAPLAGADDFVEIQLWGNQQLAFLRRFRPYVHGIPSHDTLGEVIRVLDPGLFKACFTAWVEGLRETAPDIVAIDGKTSRRACARRHGREPLHLVSAWASRQRLVLGQEAVADRDGRGVRGPADAAAAPAPPRPNWGRDRRRRSRDLARGFRLRLRPGPPADRPLEQRHPLGEVVELFEDGLQLLTQDLPHRLGHLLAGRRRRPRVARLLCCPDQRPVDPRADRHARLVRRVASGVTGFVAHALDRPGPVTRHRLPPAFPTAAPQHCG